MASGNERRLDVVDPAPAPRHPPDDAGQHGEALLAVVAVMVGGPGVDHGEGVEAGGVLAEGDEGAAQGFRRVLERAPRRRSPPPRRRRRLSPVTSSCISTDLPEPDFPVTATL